MREIANRSYNFDQTYNLEIETLQSIKISDVELVFKVKHYTKINRNQEKKVYKFNAHLFFMLGRILAILDLNGENWQYIYSLSRERNLCQQ